MKNVNFIKLAEKRHRAKRNWYTSFVVLRPILLKLVSMDAELNSALGNKKYYYWVWYLEKQPNLKKWFEIKKSQLRNL